MTFVSALVGCASSPPTPGYTPITGIQISAADVVAGHGCGTGPDQVYKYVAVVAYGAPDDATANAAAEDAGKSVPLTSGVFDCFADGLFSNLPPLDGSVQAFDISVFAYNRDSFPQVLGCGPNAVPCPGDDAAVVEPYEARATWTTSCKATESAGATAAAWCRALKPSGAGSSGDGSAGDEPPADGSSAE